MPLNPNDTIVEKIEVNLLIDTWWENFQIDISRLIPRESQILKYRCSTSGLLYFWPESLAGDGAFYEDLQRYPWYYLDEKWEYSEAAKFLQPGQSLLEIGSGRGAFLKHCRKIGVLATGLELNQAAVAESRSIGLNVKNQNLNEITETYDVLSTFQVLEHVSNPWSFLTDCFRILKQSGTFIVAVPNNNSRCVDPKNVLNMPPHHMGQWTKVSLQGALESAGFKQVVIKTEPLSKIHIKAYLCGLRRESRGVLAPLINRYTLNALQILFMPAKVRMYLEGHTLLGIARK
jgi:2-polyprenyl-3-methyl-5-hydroxy-6-metoxy-1,4-benzoquinol methylase